MGRNNKDLQLGTTEGKVVLYRGLSYVTPEDLNTRYLGNHWTKDKGIAERFAQSDEGGLVVHGEVSPEHIVPIDSEEWKNLGGGHGIWHPEDQPGEDETTLRNDAPVTITGYTHIGPTGKPIKVEQLSKPKKGKV